MINPVSLNKINSIPASIPASTPLKPSFRGNDEGDTVEFSGANEETTAEKAAPEKKTITAEDISKKVDEVSDGADAIADGVDKTVNSVTNATTKVAGAVTLIGSTIAKIIPAPIKDFFATPVVKQVEGEGGKLVDALDKNGHKIYETIKDSNGAERIVRKFNKKNTIIAAAVAAVVITGATLYKHFKNKAKQPKNVQNA